MAILNASPVSHEHLHIRTQLQDLEAEYSDVHAATTREEDLSGYSTHFLHACGSFTSPTLDPFHETQLDATVPDEDAVPLPSFARGLDFGVSRQPFEGPFTEGHNAQPVSADTSHTGGAQSLPPGPLPSGPMPPGLLLRGPLPRGPLADVEFHEDRRPRNERQKKSDSPNKYWSRFIFLIGLQRATLFDLVPKLIGSTGYNMKLISNACEAKLRIRGKGSQHKEINGPHGRVEANMPLQLCVSCHSQELLNKAIGMIRLLLDEQAKQYAAFCDNDGMPGPEAFYVEWPGHIKPCLETACSRCSDLNKSIWCCEVLSKHVDGRYLSGLERPCSVHTFQGGGCRC